MFNDLRRKHRTACIDSMLYLVIRYRLIFPNNPHKQQHTQTTTYTNNNIHKQQHTQTKTYTNNNIHKQQHTQTKTYTNNNIHIKPSDDSMDERELLREYMFYTV